MALVKEETEFERVARMEVDMLQQMRGVERSIGWMMNQDSFSNTIEDEGERRDQASDALLRAIVPAQLHAEKGILILGLQDGVLRTAVAGSYTEADIEAITKSVESMGYEIRETPEPEFIDRATIMSELAKTRRITRQVIEDHVKRIQADSSNGTLVSELAHDLITEALEAQASDIHIRYIPESVHCWVSYRILGRRQARHLLPPLVMRMLVARLKQMGGVQDYSLRSVLQDGRLTVEWQGREIDARLASKPIEPLGESVVLRLLDRARLKPLGALFAPMPKVLTKLHRLFNPPAKVSGLIVVCGQMGSGKTTSLTAMQNKINRLVYSVSEIASPVEYLVPHVNQSEALNSLDRSYAAHARAELRFDTDYIVVGEVRDQETAVQLNTLTQTGHCAICTLHTGSALGVLPRLASLYPQEEQRMNLHVLAEHLLLVIHQKLVPTLCGNCAISTTLGEVLPEEADRALLKLSPDLKVKTANHDGCEQCRPSGYPGYKDRAMCPEAILFPDNNEDRMLLAKVLENENWTDVMKVKGVEHITRGQTLAHFIRARQVDPRMALEFLKVW